MRDLRKNGRGKQEEIVMQTDTHTTKREEGKSTTHDSRQVNGERTREALTV